MYRLVEDGKLIRRELPADVKSSFTVRGSRIRLSATGSIRERGKGKRNVCKKKKNTGAWTVEP